MMGTCLGELVGGVEVRWSLHVRESRVIDGVSTTNVDWELHLKELMALVPVHLAGVVSSVGTTRGRTQKHQQRKQAKSKPLTWVWKSSLGDTAVSTMRCLRRLLGLSW